MTSKEKMTSILNEMAIRLRKPKAKWIIICVSFGIVLFVIAVPAVMHFTSQPSFCASCHQIKPQVAKWENGPHKTVTCLDCHAEPGTWGYVVRKVSSVKEVFLQVTNQVPANIEAQPHVASCIECHTGKSKVANAPNILSDHVTWNHSLIMKKGISCLECHKGVGHGTKREVFQ